MENYWNNLEKETRDKAALQYRALLLREEKGEGIPFPLINEAIITRWSMSALDYIQARAWKGGAKGETIWITRMAGTAMYVEEIEMKMFWAHGRVGFQNIQEAIKHCQSGALPS